MLAALETRERLLDVATRRYVERYGIPPAATASTDHACWRLLTPTEQVTFRIVDLVVQLG